MFEHEHILTQPVFFLFIAFSFLLSFGYFWGRRQNKTLFLSAFNDLVDVVKPDDKNFTNIGGAIGYHANLFIKKKGAISRVDATITLLPRHSWLYLPISKLIRKYDRLFITLYLKQNPSGEGHLIERKYAGFGGPKITNVARLNKEKIKWGKYNFYLYYEGMKMRDHFMKFMDQNPEPGVIRHIAIVPDQKKGFVFMIPQKGQVARYFAPIYQWLPSVIKQ
ncbi:MAG: hypothetical protein KAT81_00340 [Syntrophobacterales bacterium]|jgi:hypothetical protein|nr:hypothetical protein [Syntrophobacterales bacterium]